MRAQADAISQARAEAQQVLFDQQQAEAAEGARAGPADQDKEREDEASERSQEARVGVV